MTTRCAPSYPSSEARISLAMTNSRALSSIKSPGVRLLLGYLQTVAMVIRAMTNAVTRTVENSSYEGVFDPLNVGQVVWPGHRYNVKSRCAIQRICCCHIVCCRGDDSLLLNFSNGLCGSPIGRGFSVSKLYKDEDLFSGGCFHHDTVYLASAATIVLVDKGQPVTAQIGCCEILTPVKSHRFYASRPIRRSLG